MESAELVMLIVKPVKVTQPPVYLASTLLPTNICSIKNVLLVKTEKMTVSHVKLTNQCVINVPDSKL